MSPLQRPVFSHYLSGQATLFHQYWIQFLGHQKAESEPALNGATITLPAVLLFGKRLSLPPAHFPVPLQSPGDLKTGTHLPVGHSRHQYQHEIQGNLILASFPLCC